MKAKLLLLFCLCFWITCASYSQSIESELQERKLLLAPYFESAEKIAAKTGIEEVKGVITFLKTYGILVKPAPNGVIALESSRYKNFISIVTLKASDGSVSDGWKKRVEFRKAFGHFLPDSFGLILRSDVPTSPFMKGLIFFHEGNHALRYASELYNWEDSFTFSMKEMETHELQNKICSAYGGELYAKILQDEEKRIETFPQFVLGKSYPSRGQYDERLEEVFGPAASDFEKDFRQTQLWVHGIFRVIDRLSDTNAGVTKAKFMMTVYSKDGILPNQNN